jgi:predicted DNA-binding transcriptional regulator AlpA
MEALTLEASPPAPAAPRSTRIPPPPDLGELLISVRQACVKMQRSRQWFYLKWDPNSPHYDATFPRPIKMGLTKTARIGISLPALDAWIAAQTAPAAPAAGGQGRAL